MPGGRLWTDEDWATFRALIADGAGHRDLMVALGRSRGAISRAIKNSGLRVDPEKAAERRKQSMEARKGKPRKSPPPECPKAKKKRMAALRAFWQSEAGQAEKVRRSAFMREFRTRPEMMHLAVNAGKKSGEVRMAWCPPHLRETYRALAHGGKGYTAAEVKALLQPEIEKFKQTHEGRMWLLQTGKGKLVAAFRPTTALPDRSLIGGTLA